MKRRMFEMIDQWADDLTAYWWNNRFILIVLGFSGIIMPTGVLFLGVYIMWKISCMAIPWEIVGMSNVVVFFAMVVAMYFFSQIAENAVWHFNEHHFNEE